MQVLDQETLRERLIVKESQNVSATRGSLSKCAIRLREFTTAVQSAKRQRQQKEETKTEGNGNNDDDGSGSDQCTQAVKNTANQLTRELKLHDLEMKKMALGAQAAAHELAHYDAIQQTTAQSLTATRTEIEALRKELAHQIKVRKNRLEYEALAKMASDREPSRDTKRKLNEIRVEMDKIQDDTNKIQKKLDVKGKQFHLLSRCVQDLKNGLEEDQLRTQLEKK
jgi:hypothetical protein